MVMTYSPNRWKNPRPVVRTRSRSDPRVSMECQRQDAAGGQGYVSKWHDVVGVADSSKRCAVDVLSGPKVDINVNDDAALALGP